MIHKLLLNILFLFFCFAVASAQTQQPTYAERLGYPKGSKVIILHVDDVGMSYESNAGAVEAMTKGIANSCSMMMPCGWIPGFFQYLKNNPTTDAGLHLTLNSEWKAYRWGPLSGREKVPGMVDEEGALWSSVDSTVKYATPDEVEIEIRAQVQRARNMGFEPTHLDSHMGALFASQLFLERYVKVGIEYQIPVMFVGGHGTNIAAESRTSPAMAAQMREMGSMLWNAGLPVLDDLHGRSYDWNLPAGTQSTVDALRKFKTQQYINALQTLKPGITMVIMHCTTKTEVFPAISNSATTRYGDLLAMTDPALKAFISKEKIILTTWRELMERRRKLKSN
ncbi:MAG: polysaccharide deacetylase family protein [Chitinophagaceae bacterium]|jgi:chitin disaccharide deacetylase|nr:polysaccharide deacetylase family protein [Chitinophagaceae bacterium]